MQEHARFAAATFIMSSRSSALPWAIARGVGALMPGMLLSCVLLLAPAIGDAGAAALSLLERLPQSWRDDQGKDTSLAEFRGRPVYFTMAYATCRRVCPMTMERLQQFQKEIDAKGEHAEFVIVGYDPTLDDPPAWRQYRRSRELLRDNWHFLSGSVAGTEQLAHQLGFQFWKYDRHVMHDYRIVVLDERGELAAEYTPQAARVVKAAPEQARAPDHVISAEN
jgi:cytochrome oxidase Cu insertion factor (SCO1/SenC/PrrC family)